MEMKPRVILFSLPLQGHINPMMQLANVLLSRGFSISVVQTDFNSLSPSAYPDFTFHSIPFDPFETGSPSPAHDAFAFMRNFNVSCRVPFRECLARILSDPSTGRVACLVTTAPLYFTQAVADEFGIRRLVLQTSSICAYLALSALPLLREKGYIPLQESRVEEHIPELLPCKFKDMHQLVKRMNSEDIFSVVTSVDRSVETSSGVIWNTFDDLERDKMAEFSREFGGVQVFPIGPFHKNFPASSSSLLEADRSSIAWLDKQATDSVLYVSFGSLAQLNEAELREIAWGLANSGQPFLWVVHGSGGSMPDGFVEAVGDRGRLVKWAPQQEVLAHPATGGFWTHGGWNSTLESICEGVPMICQPFIGDQWVNTRYVSDVWRVGIHLEGRIDKGAIEKEIGRLMASEDGDEMRQRIKDMKEIAESCLKPGGSSYKSLQRLTDYMSQAS